MTNRIHGKLCCIECITPLEARRTSSWKRCQVTKESEPLSSETALNLRPFHAKFDALVIEECLQ